MASRYKLDTIRPLLIAAILTGISMTWVCFNFYHFIKLSQQKDQVDAQRYLLASYRNALVEAEAGQRGYLITNNVSFFDAYTAGKSVAAETYQAIAAHFNLFPNIKPNMMKVKRLSEEKFNIIESSIKVQLNAGSYASHLTLSKDKGKAVMESIKHELSIADSLMLATRLEYEKKIKQELERSILGGMLLVVIIIGTLVYSYIHTIKLFETILQTKEASESYAHQAEHDMLTDISNRRGFEHFVDLTHSNAHLHNLQYAILYLDLDGFKEINDTYGHHIGDTVLIHVAKTITSQLRDQDFLARLGGDEFAIVINHYQEQKSLIDIANRIIRAINQPITIREHVLKTGVSIGIAMYPQDALHKDAIISIADAAMYLSKKKGKNQYSFIQNTW